MKPPELFTITFTFIFFLCLIKSLLSLINSPHEPPEQSVPHAAMLFPSLSMYPTNRLQRSIIYNR